MASGIYQIKNTLNGKCYIGSAVDIQRRWRDHLSALRRGQHCNGHLQRSFEKYSEDAFMFAVLEQVEDTSQLIIREQHYLDTLKPEYNISPTAGSSLGVRRTEETRQKVSESKTGERNPSYGKHPSAATRTKQSAAQAGERNHNYGKHRSIATKQKISNTKKNTNMGEQNSFYGEHHSEETKRKMSIAQKARRRRERELKEK